MSLNTALLARMIRERRGGMGLRETCIQIGEISAPTLSRIENGKQPDVDTLLRICKWLEVPADTFSSSAASSEQNRREQIVTLLRGDRDLDAPTKDALLKMIDLAYNNLHH